MAAGNVAGTLQRQVGQVGPGNRHQRRLFGLFHADATVPGRFHAQLEEDSIEG